MKIATILFIALLFLTSLDGNAQVAAKQQALQNFMSDRFGMFIHLGPVALRGTEIGWRLDPEVPKQDYDSLYKKINPCIQ